MILPSAKTFPRWRHNGVRPSAGSEWHYETEVGLGFAAWHSRYGKIELLSKSQKTAHALFPRTGAELKSLKGEKIVLDGEIVISLGGSCRSITC